MLRVCRAATRMEMGYSVFFLGRRYGGPCFLAFFVLSTYLVYISPAFWEGGGITLEHALLASLFQKQIMSAVQG